MIKVILTFQNNSKELFLRKSLYSNNAKLPKLKLKTEK